MSVMAFSPDSESNLVGASCRRRSPAGASGLPKGRVPDVADQDGGQEVPSAMTHRQACAAEPKQKAPVMLLAELAIVGCCVGVSF